MPDHVVETNVLLVASAADPGSPFDDPPVPEVERAVVLEWLRQFRDDRGRVLVRDRGSSIHAEYKSKLTEQDLGWLVYMHKLPWCRFVDISTGSDGVPELPATFAAFHSDDRKFLAVALADNGGSTIVNASDTDWLAIETECSRHGVVIEQLIKPWLRSKLAEKEARIARRRSTASSTHRRGHR